MRLRGVVLARREASDRGALSVFAIIISLVVVVFFGAVVDFERKLEARHDAGIAAQEAARAGAGQVDLDRAYQNGRYVIDQQAALHAAQRYLRAGGYSGTVTAAGPRAIRVHVTVTKPALFLPVIGISTLRAEAEAVADLTTGVEGPHR
ncbi:TadG family pilus assembly protein [Thermomonospora cellulosilytica]|uniref:Flp pilus assembly protein TadG n=1 Tax=Thermomonospora cellulosilytica TaxID=1411118 RepID=A0A7W3R858_9ACTN|nr:TadG family pilus assembly protein [Thermomonospora cellulosilytica]MBA9003045.1 Flp pilus assembly protein TadG [Thermomonospora cellulosilytica]